MAYITGHAGLQSGEIEHSLSAGRKRERDTGEKGLQLQNPLQEVVLIPRIDRAGKVAQ
jgi:hypothetical protein